MLRLIGCRTLAGKRKRKLKARLAALERRARAPKAVAAAVKPEVERVKLAMSDLLARSRVGPRDAGKRPEVMFTPAEPPPGVLPAGHKLAMDEAVASTGAWAGGWAGWGAFAEGITFLGYPYLAELAQRPEYRVISEVIATEMTRKWIKLKSKSQEGGDDERIAELGDYLDNLKVRDAFCKVCELDGFFGRSHLYVDTGDGDNSDELKLSIGNGRNEVSQAKLKEGCLKRLQVIEPVWTYPTNYNASDPLKPTWYEPETWFVMGKQVHSTRLLTFVGREVPDLFKPAYSFGGLSLSQMAKPYVDNWLRTRQAVADIIKSFTVFVLCTDMNTLLTPGGDELMARVELFNNLRTNQSTMLINKVSEDFKNVSASLATLDSLQAQTQEHMAAVSRIPLVKLLGISPAGLNASSEGEIRVFYDTIAAYQQRFFKDKLTRVIDIAQVSLWGQVDDDITFEFEPLWSLDEKTLTDMRKVEADTDAVYVTEGIISTEEVRTRLAADPDSPYQGLVPADLPEPPVDESEPGLGLGQGGSVSRGESDFSQAAE